MVDRQTRRGVVEPPEASVPSRQLGEDLAGGNVLVDRQTRRGVVEPPEASVPSRQLGEDPAGGNVLIDRQTRSTVISVDAKARIPLQPNASLPFFSCFFFHGYCFFLLSLIVFICLVFYIRCLLLHVFAYYCLRIVVCLLYHSLYPAFYSRLLLFFTLHRCSCEVFS